MATVLARLRSSYPAAVVRRFFELELIDRAFGLAAQAFVALLPLVIILVTVVIGAPDQVISGNISERFGLDDTARTAMQLLFQAPASVKTLNVLAVVMSLVSAYSLSRRLSRVFAAILDLPPIQRRQLWRGLLWILLQVCLFVAASELRGLRRSSGPVVAGLAVVVLVLMWILADMAGLRLLVPSVSRRLLVSSALVASVGRIGLAAWAAVYMPKALSEQAGQYGPIGVTFAFFTFILAGVFVYIGAPLLTTTWYTWREQRARPALSG